MAISFKGIPECPMVDERRWISPEWRMALTNQVSWSVIIDLSDGEVTGRLPFTHVQQVTANKLLGRGSAGGTGDIQEITLGTNLSMSGTTLNATTGGSDAETLAWLAL